MLSAPLARWAGIWLTVELSVKMVAAPGLCVATWVARQNRKITNPCICLAGERFTGYVQDPVDILLAQYDVGVFYTGCGLG